MIVKIKNCPACGSKNISKVVSLDDKRKNSYLIFSELKYNQFLDDWLELLDIAIYGCSDCGHHNYKEQPSNEMLSAMYENGEALLPETSINRREPTAKMIHEMNKLKKILNIKNPKLLDYGSGFGAWARAASGIGFDVTAFEPSQERGSENKPMDFNLIHHEDELIGQFFDIINLEQVLEHIPDPVVLLKKLKVYCKPNTLLRISVPNILRCPEENNIWNDWPYDGRRVHTMSPFEHLHGFTPKSLNKVSQRAGFRVVNNLSAWTQYPKEMLRRYVGKIFPRLGQTFLILKIKDKRKS
jgi:SAM-dependent methyltransferase